MTLDHDARRQLAGLARDSIAHGLERGRPAAVAAHHFPADLRGSGASFVTLEIEGRLRGCIGSLEAHRPLVVDVAENAFAAAFRDPRFAPLDGAEFDALRVKLSVLGAPEPLAVTDEAELLERLRPGEDGLILEAAGRRATFLPAVWESLPEPAEFLAQLRRKAGLPADFWSPAVRVWRYGTESFE